MQTVFKDYKSYKDYLNIEIKKLIDNKDNFNYSFNMIFRFKHYLKLLKHFLSDHKDYVRFKILPDNRSIIFRIENLKNDKPFDFIVYEDLIYKIIIDNKNIYRLKQSTNSFFIKEFESLFNFFIEKKPNHFLNKLESFKSNKNYIDWLHEIRDIQQYYISDWLSRIEYGLKNILFELSFLSIGNNFYYNSLIEMYVQIISIDFHATTMKNCTKSSKFYISYKIAYSSIKRLKDKNIKSCELYDFCNQLELSCRQKCKEV